MEFPLPKLRESYSMQKITVIKSRENPRLINARKVRDGKNPDSIYVEGTRVCEEALRSGVMVTECFYSPYLTTSERGKTIIDTVISRGIIVIELSESLFRSVANTANSQGIIFLCNRPANGADLVAGSLKRSELKLCIFLYKVNDPANVGAIFRSAEAAGVAGIITSKGSADVFSAKSVRAAMGANLRLSVWEKADIEDVRNFTVDNGLQIVAADGGRPGVIHTNIAWKSPTLLMLGGEANGLDDKSREIADAFAFIPMKNGVESLNLAVAAGILMFEAARQNS